MDNDPDGVGAEFAIIPDGTRPNEKRPAMRILAVSVTLHQSRFPSSALAAADSTLRRLPF